MRFLILAFALAAFGWTCPVLAWDATGHKTVGAIADDNLNPNAKTMVDALIGMSLEQAGPWLDCVKDVKRENGVLIYKPEPAYAEGCKVFWEPPFSDAILAFATKNWRNCSEGTETFGCHNVYHFADIDVSPSAPAYGGNLPGAFEADVVHAINAAIDVLNDEKPPKPFPADLTKPEALLMLAHLVGDIHQAMHAGSIYLNKDGSETAATTGIEATDMGFTRGGNWLWLKTGNVHGAWDKVTPDIGAEAIKQAKGQFEKSKGDINGWAETWASDVIGIAKVQLEALHYGPEDGHRHWRVAGNTEGYSQSIEGTQEQQLAIAGHHFADLLNAIWP